MLVMGAVPELWRRPLHRNKISRHGFNHASHRARTPGKPDYPAGTNSCGARQQKKQRDRRRQNRHSNDAGDGGGSGLKM
jgi:hypothetical protein